MNYKKLYRAIHVAATLPVQDSAEAHMRALRIAREMNWSSTPFVHRKIVSRSKRRSIK